MNTVMVRVKLFPRRKKEGRGTENGEGKNILISIRIFFKLYSPLSSSSFLPPSLPPVLPKYPLGLFNALSKVSHGPPDRNKPDATHTLTHTYTHMHTQNP